MDNGSGSLIAPDKVLTAWHNLRNYRVGNLQVVLTDGTVVPATVLKRDRVPDLALLKLKRPTLVPFVQLAQEEPDKGDTVTIHGYPFGDREAEAVTGQVREWLSAVRTGPDIVFAIDKRCKPGMSGGPAINDQKEQCGVLWGTLAAAHVTGIEAVHKFLEDDNNDRGFWK